jgi:uncharacterized phiE125 gp8 family phage protein
MGLTIGTPTEEAVSRDEAKRQLRVTTDDENDIIDRCITAAGLYVEAFTARSLVNRTNVWTLDRFPTATILDVPRAPLGSVTTLKYIDTAGDQQTWGAANYTVDTASTPGRISTAYNIEWPSIREVIDAVEITYVGGYGATGSTVDGILRTCVLMYVVDLFEHRGSQSEMKIQPNDAIDTLMRSKMVPEIR